MTGKRGPISERFYRHFTVAENGCWLWHGAKDKRGYGQMSVGSKTRYATHVSLILAGRPLRQGECACHHCDTPACVNPDHLFSGDQKANVLDMINKGRANHTGLSFGRGVKREHYESVVLSDEKIEKILTSPFGSKLMAKEIGCSPATVRYVRKKLADRDKYRGRRSRHGLKPESQNAIRDVFREAVRRRA